jgi:2-keto-4-pentenoate hydratase
MSGLADDPRIRRGMEAQFAMRQKLIEAGATPIGWKIGFGTPAAMAKLQIAAPLIGFMMDRGRLTSGSAVSLQGWKKPVAEPEIAVHIARDLSGVRTGGEVANAIAALAPAIELADLDQPPEDPEAVLSGNIYHRNVVLGPPDPARAGGVSSGWTGRVSRNDEEIASVTNLEANTGRILELVAHVAGVLAAFGTGLRKGDVIICGSVIPPLELGRRDEKAAFHLDSKGCSCSVRFEWGQTLN